LASGVKKLAKTNWYKMRAACIVRSVLDPFFVHSCYFSFENICYLCSFLYFASLVWGVSLNPLMESILKIHVQQYLLSWPWL